MLHLIRETELKIYVVAFRQIISKFVSFIKRDPKTSNIQVEEPNEQEKCTWNYQNKR